MNNKFMQPDSCMKNINLHNTFRKLWEEHVMWTRLFLISTISSLGDLPLVTKRLLRNPDDFALELQKYYGQVKAKEFAVLLSDHLQIAAKLVNSMRAKDMNSIEDNKKKWLQNADEIALFLNSINPFWNKRVWEDMLHQHLRVTENEVRYRLIGQYAADIAEYNEIENQALKMADYMADGIRKQFHR